MTGKQPPSTPPLPKHLRPATLAWFQSVQSDYVLEEHHRKILLVAAESWDRALEAREVLAREGLTYTNRHGEFRARPEIGIEKDAKIAFLRALRELALDVEAPSDAPRPPTIRR